MKKAIKRVTRRAVRFAAREWDAEQRRIEARRPASARAAAPAAVKGSTWSATSCASSAPPRSTSRLVQFFTWNHRWVAHIAERNRRAAASTYDFIDADMPDALFWANQFDVIGSKSDEMIRRRSARQILD